MAAAMSSLSIMSLGYLISSPFELSFAPIIERDQLRLSGNNKADGVEMEWNLFDMLHSTEGSLFFFDFYLSDPTSFQDIPFFTLILILSFSTKTK